MEPILRRNGITGITQIPFNNGPILRLKHCLAAFEECQKQNGITPPDRMASERRPVSVPDSIRLVGEPRLLNTSPKALPSADCTEKLGFDYWMDLVSMFPRHISARTPSVRLSRSLASHSSTGRPIGVSSENPPSNQIFFVRSLDHRVFPFVHIAIIADAAVELAGQQALAKRR